MLKDAFHRLGSAHHPDAAGGNGDAFAAVNTAWQVLRDPAQRLRHLLELEGASPASSAQIPPTLADTFMSIAALRRGLEDFLQKDAAATGALAKALLAGERASLERNLRQALTRLGESNTQTLEEVRAIDAVWSNRDAAKLARLADLQQSLAFSGKWSDQLREALFKLGA